MWVLLSLVSGQTALSQTRIANAVNNNERVVVRGTTPALIAKSTDTGRMTAGQNLGRMILQLAPSAEQDQKAAKFVAALHDPSSPSYHKWLTPAQFGQLYGVSDYDAAQVQHWLQGRGLTVHEVSQSHRFIVFSGTVSQVEDAFATQMHTYSYKNAAFIANSTDIQIPAALQPVVKGVVRLHSDPHQPNAFMGGKVYFKKSPGLFSFSDGTAVRRGNRRHGPDHSHRGPQQYRPPGH
jgi:subtilase family serine protease